MKKEKELTASQSMKKVKDLLKDKSLRISRSKLVPGQLYFCFYDAKDKEMTYDKTPMVFLLRKNKTHTLGINFHWAPMPLRILLVKQIIKMNKNNIKLNKPLEFSYNDLKPFLKKIGFSPIIRLYINKRISSSVTVVPPSEFMNAARLKSETFTKGKMSAEQLYKKAIQGNKSYRKNRKHNQ